MYLLFFLYSNFFSENADIGLSIKRKKNPHTNIANPTGLKISMIEYPTFLIDINSLLPIKLLYKKAVEIIITKGIIWPIVVGNFNNDKYKIEKKSKYPDSSILEISIKFIICINKDNKKSVKIIYFNFNKNK